MRITFSNRAQRASVQPSMLREVHARPPMKGRGFDVKAVRAILKEWPRPPLAPP